jgi:hypothetical protein
VMHYIEVQNFFFTIWTSWVSKDAEFYVDFKNINFFAIFGTFERYITNLRGTFVENVKKVKN